MLQNMITVDYTTPMTPDVAAGLRFVKSLENIYKVFLWLYLYSSLFLLSGVILNTTVKFFPKKSTTKIYNYNYFNSRCETVGMRTCAVLILQFPSCFG